MNNILTEMHEGRIISLTVMNCLALEKNWDFISQKKNLPKYSPNTCKLNQYVI